MDWSAGAERIHGYPAPEAIGLRVAALYEPADRANAVPEQELIEAVGGRETFAGWRLRRDGSRFHATIQIASLCDDEAHVSGFVVMTHESSMGAVQDRAHRELTATLQAIHLHLWALHEVTAAVSDIKRVAAHETSADVVAKLNVLDRRFAMLERTLRVFVHSGTPRMGHDS
jgi:PAS domain S-box-containing protein